MNSVRRLVNGEEWNITPERFRRACGNNDVLIVVSESGRICLTGPDPDKVRAGRAWLEGLAPDMEALLLCEEAKTCAFLAWMIEEIREKKPVSDLEAAIEIVRTKGRRSSVKAPEYLKKILELDTNPVPGKLQHAVVEHEKHCRIWRGGECTCNPRVRLVDEWPERT